MSADRSPIRSPPAAAAPSDCCETLQCEAELRACRERLAEAQRECAELRDSVQEWRHRYEDLETRFTAAAERHRAEVEDLRRQREEEAEELRERAAEAGLEVSEEIYAAWKLESAELRGAKTELEGQLHLAHCLQSRAAAELAGLLSLAEAKAREAIVKEQRKERPISLHELRRRFLDRSVSDTEDGDEDTKFAVEGLYKLWQHIKGNDLYHDYGVIRELLSEEDHIEVVFFNTASGIREWSFPCFTLPLNDLCPFVYDVVSSLPALREIHFISLPSLNYIRELARRPDSFGFNVFVRYTPFDLEDLLLTLSAFVELENDATLLVHPLDCADWCELKGLRMRDRKAWISQQWGHVLTWL